MKGNKISCNKPNQEDEGRNYTMIMRKAVWRTDIVKMTILPKTSYRFNVIPVKTPTIIFLGKKPLKIIWNQKRPRQLNQSSIKRIVVKGSLFQTSRYIMNYRNKTQYGDGTETN